jgi:hypothetical protein
MNVRVLCGVFLLFVSIEVNSAPISIGGFSLDSFNFADTVNFWNQGGTLEPGNLQPDTGGSGLALNVADAVLGSNVNKYLNGAVVELGFVDNILTNNANVFDVLVFEIGLDGDGFEVSSSKSAYELGTNLFIPDSERILTGFFISTGQALTAYLIDLSDLGVAEGSSISSFYIQGSGIELAAVSGVSVALPDLGVQPISEPTSLGACRT